MTAKELAAIAAGLLLVAGAVTVLNEKGQPIEVRADELPADVKTVAKATLTRGELAFTYLGKTEGGEAVAYVVQNGEAKKLDAMPCARRRPETPPEECQRNALTPSGTRVARDFGEWTRFPADEAVGGGCELVPCGKWAGDVDEEEKEK